MKKETVIDEELKAKLNRGLDLVESFKKTPEVAVHDGVLYIKGKPPINLEELVCFLDSELNEGEEEP